MTTYRSAVLAYLDAVMAATELDLTGVARRARVWPSTLTRFANSDEVKHTLSIRTLSKIASMSGLPIPAQVAQGPNATFSALQHGDKYDQLVAEQLGLLNRSWDSLFDDERAAIIATAKAFIANRPKSA